MLEKERFSKEEASKHRTSKRLADLLAVTLAFSRWPIYDFGCGDGSYLRTIFEECHGLKTCIGIDASPEIPKKQWPWVIHPVDAASPITLGPPGDVLCIEVGEHISSERIPGLLANLNRHCKGLLILSWAIRGQGGTRHISCRDAVEVMQMILPLGFVFLEKKTTNFREEAGQDLWWFKQSLYVFERK